MDEIAKRRRGTAPNAVPERPTARGGGCGSGGRSIRALLVDDQDIYREGIKELLRATDVQIVADAPSGEHGIALAARVRPDVVIMDAHLPGISGANATRRIISAAPNARVLMLSSSDDSADVVDALIAGASAYVLKDGALAELAGAIRTVAAGGSFLSPGIAAQIVQRVRELDAAPKRGLLPASDLSERETEVLGMIGRGAENATIAEALHLSPATVKRHVSNILRKLGVDNRIQAAVYAARRGLC
jgi:DNA-binding NarL/FixJ family response regulator